MAVDIDLGHLAQVVFVSFLHCKGILSPSFLYFVLFGRKLAVLFSIS